MRVYSSALPKDNMPQMGGAPPKLRRWTSNIFSAEVYVLQINTICKLCKPIWFCIGLSVQCFSRSWGLSDLLIVQSFPRSSVLHIPTKAPRRIQRRRLRDWGVIQWSGSKLVAMVECKESHSTGPAWSYCRYTRTHAACIQTIFLKHQRYIRFGRYLEHPKGLFIGVGYQTVLSNDTIDYQTVLSTIKRYYQTVLSTDSRVRHNPENTKIQKKLPGNRYVRFWGSIHRSFGSVCVVFTSCRHFYHTQLLYASTTSVRPDSLS